MERDNGLEADSFAFLGTVDQRLSGELLSDLADEGIAAYAVSADPGESLYVDQSSLAYARALLRRSLAAAEPADGERSPADSVDDTWERLVADFHSGDRDGDPSWPQAENAEAESDPGDEATDTPSGRRRARVSIVSLDDDDQAADPDDDHFVPPEPPPLPKGDLWTKLAWLVMLAAVAYPTAGYILDWRMPGWAIVLAVAGFVGGIVTHVVRMRDPQQEDSGPDDGAVV